MASSRFRSASIDARSTAGGGTPTRSSVYQLPEVVEAEQAPSELPNMLSGPAVRTAWEPENIGLRPKIPMWNACDTAIFTELSKMIAGQSSPQEAMTAATERFDQIVEEMPAIQHRHRQKVEHADIERDHRDQVDEGDHPERCHFP